MTWKTVLQALLAIVLILGVALLAAWAGGALAHIGWNAAKSGWEAIG